MFHKTTFLLRCNVHGNTVDFQHDTCNDPGQS